MQHLILLFQLTEGVDRLLFRNELNDNENTNEEQLEMQHPGEGGEERLEMGAC